MSGSDHSNNSQIPQSSGLAADAATPVTVHMLNEMYRNLLTQQQQQFQQMMATIASTFAPRVASASAFTSSVAHNPILQSGIASSSASSLPSKVRLSQPANFLGAGEINVDSWLFQMVQYLDASGCSEDQRLIVAATFLKGAANNWWFNQNKSLNCPTTWEEFALALRTRFQPVAASSVARAQLHSLRQGNLSVAEYSSKFQTILNLVPDMAEADQIVFFTNGLNSSIRRDVGIQDPKTLNDAMIKAQKMESLTNLHSDRRHFSSSIFSSPASSSYTHAQSSGPTPTASSAPASVPAAMELGNLNVEAETLTEQKENEKEWSSEYERYLEEGDEYEPPMDAGVESEQDRNEEEQVQQLQAMNFRAGGNGRNIARVPLTEAEFTRRRKEGLCLRCGKPGHIARHCSAPPWSSSQPSRFNSYSSSRNRSFPSRGLNGQFQPTRNF